MCIIYTFALSECCSVQHVYQHLKALALNDHSIPDCLLPVSKEICQRLKLSLLNLQMAGTLLGLQQ